MKTYVCKPGQTAPLKVMVKTENGIRPLNPRTDLMNHSPSGFNSGYTGSGPAQLALALCADAFGSVTEAMLSYQKFKFEWVALVQPEAGFEITDDFVRDLCRRLRKPHRPITHGDVS